MYKLCTGRLKTYMSGSIRLRATRLLLFDVVDWPEAFFERLIERLKANRLSGLALKHTPIEICDHRGKSNCNWARLINLKSWERCEARNGAYPIRAMCKQIPNDQTSTSIP